MQKNETGPLSTTYTKINSKWIKDLNVKTENYKNASMPQLLDIDIGDTFLNLTTKAKAIEVEINKWDYFKLNSFSTTKEAIDKIKIQTMER